MFSPIVKTVKIKGHSTDGVPLLIKKTVLVWYIDTLENLKKGGEKSGDSSCFRLPKS